ncbi:MAG TPA: alpha/beta hydrolase [Pseudomonadales bacterium]|nr:alpha/beta hydrolase [Gammaproteobacteria bacterium]HIL85721.1 alpha/beta hydrolase [Pseudomonadales bacterium]
MALAQRTIMLRSKVLAISVFLTGYVITAGTAAGAQTGQFVAPEMDTHLIESKFVDQTFEIYVQVPWNRGDDSERFPVLYQTDSYGHTAFSDTTSIMQLGGDVPRFITVGIGYDMKSPVNWLEIRTRDLTQVEGATDIPSLAPLFKDAPSPNLKQKSGGAAAFLKFIRQELQPFIDSQYPTVPEERGYWGDSLGGLFGLYVLFNQPDTFNRYIIGSPSIWWADRAIMNDAEAYIAAHDGLQAKVFMSVGALEEVGGTAAAKSAMVTNMFHLEDMLREANLKGLELTTHLFPNETHTSVIGMNYSRGIQTVYTRPVQPMIVQMMTPPGDKQNRPEGQE